MRRRLAARRPSDALRIEWRDAAKEAKLIGRVPHDFRRTAVRNLECAGVPRSVAMALGGHKIESMYRRYDIASEADLSEGVARLARYQQTRNTSRRQVDDGH